jgi:single-strand DNA-binding protein
MNQTFIAGHLGADPEVRFTSSGRKVTTLRVAARVRRRSKDKDRDDTIWWRVSVWGEEFDKMIAYLKKGSPVMVMGELDKPEIFTDREGKPQVSMSVTAQNLMFSPFGRPESSAHEASTSAEPLQHSPAFAAEPAAFGQGKGSASYAEDDIPF